MIDESWSQAHAMTMVDLNGDGKMDFVTGKRYMALLTMPRSCADSEAARNLLV